MKQLIPLALAILLGACAAAPAAKSDAPLLDTHWKAVELEGMTVEAATGSASGKRNAHLILRTEKNMAGGFSGCNNVRGGYELQGESLRFRQMASTLMACLPGADGTGQHYHSALAAIAAFRISGESL